MVGIMKTNNKTLIVTTLALLIALFSALPVMAAEEIPTLSAPAEEGLSALSAPTEESFPTLSDPLEEDDIRQEIVSRKEVKSFKFTEVKKTDGSEGVVYYSGKTVIWEGELVRKIDNDAYFEYILKLSTGDEIRVLSGRGIDQKVGDYVKITGMILIRDSTFSHLVLNKIEQATRKVASVKTFSIPGMISLDASDDVKFKRIYEWILWYNGGINHNNAQFIANRIVYYSKKHGQDPFLVAALMSAESAFNISAMSNVGAIGLGQLMPGTASSLGVNPYDPEQNIEGSVRYLMYQMNRWKNSELQMAYALASYNAGPGAVIKYNGIPPYRETIEYVNVVSSLYYKIRKK